MKFLNDQITNTDFLEFVTDFIHNVVVSTVNEAGHPFAQVCDALYHDNNKLYIMTKKGNDLYNCIEHAPELVITASKGEGTMDSVGIAINGKAYDADHKYQEKILAKNLYLNQIYAGHLEEAKEYMHTIEIMPEVGSIYDIRIKPIYQRKFEF